MKHNCVNINPYFDNCRFQQIWAELEIKSKTITPTRISESKSMTDSKPEGNRSEKIPDPDFPTQTMRSANRFWQNGGDRNIVVGDNLKRS